MHALVTAMGTILGVAAVVAALGLAQTASHQVSRRFDAIQATEVRVRDPSAEAPGSPFPPRAGTKAERLPGVVAAGRIVTLIEDAPIRRGPSEGDELTGSLTAVSRSALDAAHPKLSAGRLFNRFSSSRGEPVALVGEALARRLQLTGVEDQPGIFVGSTSLTVIGFLEDAEREPELVDAVIVPISTARRQYRELLDQAAKDELLIETEPGAAQVVGDSVALALRPDAPDVVQVLAPPDPRTLRRAVESDLDAVVAIVGLLAIAVGLWSIMNTALTSVLARIHEIGVRRALGALPQHIAAHVILDTTIMGLLGSLVGASLGTIVVAGVAVARGWTAVLDPLIPLLAPLAGSAAGAVAGIYPGLTAARFRPVEALRR